MATILYIGTFGSDDPTRATMPFLMATGALEAGHQPRIALAGEAAYLMKDYIADQVAGVGLAPLRELLPKLIEHSVPIYV
jgi:predicted peroxiredoxin